MRTLSDTLLAAQKKPDRLPYVEAKVYDYEQGIKRLAWTRIYNGSEPDNNHGIAFDGNGDMHRIRAGADNKLYHQKIANPGPTSDYSQWTQIATDCAGPCAIAAYGAKVYIFYRKSDNTLRKYYSHDYGQSWNNGQLAPYADTTHLAACWWGTGDIVVCFALKGSTPAQVNGIVLNTQDQSTTQHEWHDDSHPILETLGIGATYSPDDHQCHIVIAGKQSASPYNHYDIFRTWFSATYNFGALESFITAAHGEDITYEYPDCHIPANAQDYETTRILAVEKFSGTTAYTRPITCHRVKGTAWSSTTLTEPKPFLLDITPTYGLRLQSTTTYWWLEKPDGVWRAPRSAGDPLDISSDIITLTQHQDPPNIRGDSALTIELDNSKGQYANPGQGALASLRFRSEIVIKLGYKTSAGNETSEAGTYWIDEWEYSSTTNQSLFTIRCLDAYALMNRWTARYQMRWNKDQINPKTVWQILHQLLARAGINLTNSPAKPQSTAINNFYPDFTVDPGTAGDTAIRRLLSLVPDKLVPRGQEAFTKNPLPDEASCYSYGTDHAILTGEYRQAVTLSRSRAIGRDANGNRIVQEATDTPLLDLAIDILQQDYDPNLQTTTRAQERADAILRTQAQHAHEATITVPANVGQELLDVIQVTDARSGIAQKNYRVLAIQTHYDRRKGQYHHRLALGAP